MKIFEVNKRYIKELGSIEKAIQKVEGKEGLKAIL